MLIAIAALILVALIVIGKDIRVLTNQLREASRCSSCHGSGHARGAPDPEEQCGCCMGEGTATGEVNRSLGLIRGQLSSIHNMILEIWACPTCHGSGEEFADFLNHLSDPRSTPKPCQTCKGTGRRAESV